MSHEAAVEAALAVMRAHIDALNARDEQAIAMTLHFPHHRLSGAELKVWATPDSYLADFKDRAGTTWNRSQFSDIQVLAASEDKVHLDVEVLRYDHSDLEIARFRSLWVITFDGTRWAAKFRSSFASR